MFTPPEAAAQAASVARTNAEGPLVFRHDADANGFSPVRVATGEKRPIACGWQDGDPVALTDASPGALSTGIRTDGLRALDIDIDDPEIAALVRVSADQMLGATITRTRDGSPRALLVYRAADGEPSKKSIAGAGGKVEVLGRGQQFVADGEHPSAGRYRWEAGRGPHNTRRDDLPSVTEQQIADFFAAVAPLIGADQASEARAANTRLVDGRGGASVVPFPGRPPAVFANRKSPLNAAAQAGLPSRNWFDGLSPEQKNGLVRAILAHPEVVGLADRPRGEWLNLLFAMADAEHRGATGARALARAWCETSLKFKDDADFDRDWDSFAPRPDGVTVATLLDAAVKVGVDLTPWHPSGSGSTTVVAGAPTLAAAFGPPVHAVPFFASLQFERANLHPVSWLMPDLLIRGDTTVLAGQGGGAKTAFAVCIAVALAAGRPRLGPLRANTRPAGLRIAFMSGEEDSGRIALLVAAACNVLALTAAERGGVAANLMVHNARESGWRLGEPPPDSRADIAPETNDRGLAELRVALEQHKPDVLVLDTLAALFALPNENDNSVVTALMQRLSRLVRNADCAVLLLHHTPKMTREAAAGQRGEATLVRGGSAIVNSARVVLTITAPPASEAAEFAMQGHKPDAVRRLEHAKINDAPPMEPAFFVIRSEQVQVHDGSDHAVRAIEFLSRLTVAGGGIPDAMRNVAMKAIDAGVLNDHGAKVPLSPGGGREKRRDAVRNVARALISANPVLTEPQAQSAARKVLKDLMDRLGCVVEQEVHLPQYKPDGQPNGKRKARGLVCRWELALSMLGPAAPATTPDAIGEPAAPPDGAAEDSQP